MTSRSFKLEEVKIEVTHDCALKCVHCSSMADSRFFQQIEPQDCERILCQARDLEVGDIAFSGGEPLAWPHIANAVRRSKQLGFRVTIYSTGIVKDVKGILRELKEARIDRAIFSMYSANYEIHDSITRVSGSFIATVHAIKTAINMGIKVELHFVPMKSNFLELGGIVKFAEGMDIDKISVLRLVPQGRGSAGNLSLSIADTIALKKMISDHRGKGTNIRLGSPYSILCPADSPSCGAAINKMTISPTLSIAPCDAFKQITAQSLGIDDEFGNLSTCSLKAAWEKSSYFNLIRDYLFSSVGAACVSCQSLEKCHSGCVAQKVHHSGNLLKVQDPLYLAQNHKHTS